MVVLTLLVKSVTSLLKNYVGYYTENLETELDSFLRAVVGKGLAELSRGQGSWLSSVNWRVVGEELLTADRIEALLARVGGAAGLAISRAELEQRLALHAANLRYAFGLRMKNLALATGLGLCLGLDVNAFTIWKTLYSDQQVRTTFATQYATKALAMADELARTEAGTPATGTPTKQQLEVQSRKLHENVDTFMADVSFGVGRIWTDAGRSLGFWGVCHELLGALLTGLLVSIAAPYWHDLLRALASLRSRR